MIPVVCLSRKASFVQSVRASGHFDVLARVSDREGGEGASFVRSRRELSGFLKGRFEDAVILVSGFGIIIGADEVSSRPIFNFHPGDLATNRGPTPAVWSILQGDSEAKMTLHRMGEKVDTGLVIAQKTVPVLPDDTVPVLSARLEETVPELLLSLADYLEGARPPVGEVSDGIYRARVVEKDYTIDPDRDSIEVIGRKVRSQAAWHGAILELDGRAYRVFGLDVRPAGEAAGEGDGTVTLTRGDSQLVFSLQPQI